MRKTTAIKTIALTVALTVASALAACTARGPSATDALALQGPVAADRTRIIILVPDDVFALALGGDVFINRRRIGRLEHNTALFADVLPGTQVISTNTELGYDTTLRTKAGETVYVRIAHGVGQLLHVTGAEVIPPDVGQRELAGHRLPH